MSVDPSLFRDYDIRGIYPEQLNRDIAFLLGQAIASYLKVKEIAVGYDMRLSSPELFAGLSEGITQQGVDVINLGQISTEIHNFASGKYRFPANIIISASHNPGQYNGLKIVTAGAVPLHGGFGLPEIKKLALGGNFPDVSSKGNMREQNIMEAWITHALSRVDIASFRPLKVVVDAGNGMGGESWKKLIGKLPIEIIPLYFDPDGTFPHHLADPIKRENQLDLAKEIVKQKADMGIALDGDADRMFLVDEQGNGVSGTITCALLASALLEKNGPAPVLYNAVCGRIVPETIGKFQGKAIRVRVGHSFIKERMRAENALFAGEHSGHFYFRDNYYADSSLIAGLVCIEYISKKNVLLSKLVRQLNKYATSGEINFKTVNPESVIENIKKQYQSDAKSTDVLDGLSVWYDDWWFNLRASKTEPFVRLNIEADTPELLQSKSQKLYQILETNGAIKV